MIIYKKNQEVIPHVNCCGGEGTTLVTDLLIKDENLYKNAKLVAYAKLEPGNSIGYHVHDGEMEAYILIKGQGIYNDNGKEVEVDVGDVTVTFSGEGHAIKPRGDETLEFIAVICEI